MATRAFRAAGTDHVNFSLHRLHDGQQRARKHLPIQTQREHVHCIENRGAFTGQQKTEDTSTHHLAVGESVQAVCGAVSQYVVPLALV